MSHCPLNAASAWSYSVAVAVCCVSTRNDAAENTHWFSVPLYLHGSSFFSIRYDTLLHGCSCCTWAKTQFIIYKRAVGLLRCTHMHSKAGCKSASVLLRSGLRCLIHLCLPPYDRWEIKRGMSAMMATVFNHWNADEPVDLYKHHLVMRQRDEGIEWVGWRVSGNRKIWK